MFPKLGFTERFFVLLGGTVLVSVGQWFFEEIRLQSSVVLGVASYKDHKNINDYRHYSETLVKQLLLIENSNDVNSRDLSVESIRNLFPRPDDSVAIYNSTTMQRLRHLLFNNSNDNESPVILCVNGGSSTAGGGRSAGRQYYQHLPNYFHTASTTLQIVERGHGNRHSWHSSQMAAWYWPRDVNILIWEFSINDVAAAAVEDEVPSQSSGQKKTDERNQLISWLDQVARLYQPEPPLVILVYLWNSPFAMTTTNDNNQQKIKSDVFESHRLLAAQYDFVVGHVHLAQYMTNELAWNYELADLFFLADRHHPSPLGHAVLSYLLVDLITNEQRSPLMIHKDGDFGLLDGSNRTLAQFTWTCGTDTTEKRFFQQHIANRPPVASFTMEVPRHNSNELNAHSGNLKAATQNGMFTTRWNESQVVVNYGRANPHRQDRQNAVVLPCCASAHFPTKTTNDTAVPNTLDLFQNSSSSTPAVSLRAIQLAILPAGPETYFRVYLDHDDDIVAHDYSTRITTAPATWDCLWNYRGIYPQVAWVLLSPSGEPKNVSKIRLCSTKPANCGRQPPPSKQHLQHRDSSQALMSMVAY